MDLDDLQPRKKLPELVLGEDISALSANELESASFKQATRNVGPNNKTMHLANVSNI